MVLAWCGKVDADNAKDAPIDELLMLEKINLLGIPINKVTLQEVMHHIDASIRNKKKLLVSVLDAALMINMQSNRKSFDAICSSDIVTADGYYVVLASKFLKQPLAEQVTGFDIATSTIRLAHDKGYKIFFFGAEEWVVSSIVQRYTALYGSGLVAGYRNGYFKENEIEQIITTINESRADILLIGISSPLREIFLSTYKNQLNISFMIGVGGVFDILGGKTTRAPLLIQKIRLEWLYRFLLEPRRLWRRVFYSYPAFVYFVLRQKLKNL